MKRTEADRFIAPFLTGFLLIIGLPFLSHGGELSGRVLDEQSQALGNANLQIQPLGAGTSSDSSGYFHFSELAEGRHSLIISHIGYSSRIVPIQIPGSKPLEIHLLPTIIRLSEVSIEGTTVSDRRAPITQSSLSAEEVSRDHGVQDIPLLLDSQPGVYVSNDAGGGFGDSRLMIRGFDEKRLQILVNNIPINDPETREVAWSNWSAIPAATQTIQVQRGVGTGLYGSGALGGAVNIVTLDTPEERSLGLHYTQGRFGVQRIGLNFDSGLSTNGTSYAVRTAYFKGSGWRENTFQEGFQYYLSASRNLNTHHFLKLILHGAPQYHTLSFAGLNAASYARPDQFVNDAARLNDYGQYAFGFGPDFNGNVHTAAVDLNSTERQRDTDLLDAILFRSRIGADPSAQVGGFVLNQDRASLNNNVSHRPRLELHHSWYLAGDSKLTSTAFITRGLDYSDDVYPAWYIPRSSDGRYDHTVLLGGNYWGGNQVFEYRYYSDLFQLGLLSSYASPFGSHDLSVGLETRHWSARHAGEVLNTFGQAQVGVPIGSVVHPLEAGDLFYDFTTTKDQAALFGHIQWNWPRLVLMTNLQLSTMAFRVLEAIPSNNNYPDHLDESALLTHGGPGWLGTASWDDDQDSSTAEVPVSYTLWDYHKAFHYITPRLGLSFTLTQELLLYTNLSLGVKEPEIKHFYGYGAPQDDLELEMTRDLELGLTYRRDAGPYPFTATLTAYRIAFAGKLMQITLPEKANTPGYDYAGHTYVPVGDASYSGLEFSGLFRLPLQLSYATSVSASRNVWGEPGGTPGAQKLYANVARAGIDYADVNGNGAWDEGGSEQALHQEFVSRYGARYDVGMPQLIWNQSLSWSRNGFAARLSLRYFRDLYVLENNAELLVGPGSDELFFTDDDVFSATLPAVLITDLQFGLDQQLREHRFKLSLQVKNLLDVNYWQRGDEFGVLPGGARTWLTRLDLAF